MTDRKQRMEEKGGARRGMTIVEALVWIAVFIAAMIALVSSVLYFYRTSAYAIEQSSATASAQHGIDVMIRAIREAQYAANGAYPVVSIGANDLRFYAYNRDDSLIDELHYFLSGNSLVKGIIQPAGDPAAYTGAEATSTISGNVQNIAQSTPLFTYYDKNGTQITNYAKIGDVRFVSATLLIDVDTNRPPDALSLHSSAAMRNLVGK